MFSRLRRQLRRAKAVTASKEAARLALDLALVFVGVYLAFLLSEFQKQQENEARQQQLYCAIAQELADFIAVANLAVPAMTSLEAGWDADFEAGKMPVPLYPQTGAVDRPPTSMWQATLESGAIEHFDIPLMYRLSKFYHGYELVTLKGDRLAQYALTQILPYSKDGSHFYDSASGQLHAHHLEYMRMFREVSHGFGGLLGTASELRSEVSALCEPPKS